MTAWMGGLCGLWAGVAASRQRHSTAAACRAARRTIAPFPCRPPAPLNRGCGGTASKLVSSVLGVLQC
jgi:hypothetical protein